MKTAVRMKSMRILLTLALPLAVFATDQLAASQARAQGQEALFSDRERGRYLADIGDCAACHTAPGGKPFAGGLALETPFGQIVTPNITPDRETGIGGWSEDQFIHAMQTGMAPGGKHLYPAFPYPYYTKVRPADLAAIWTYLQTLAPVHNPVKSNQLPFPFSIRSSLIGWNLLSFKKGEFKPDPAKSPEWNRGAYLVEGLGHCGACHTPKTLWGGDRMSKALQGGELQGWMAPDITGVRGTGLGNWSTGDIVAYLKTGANAHSLASGPMREAVEHSTSRMSEADLQAIAVYLKDQPGKAERPQPLAADTAKMKSGAAIYQDACAACHTASGAGIAELFPPLRQNSIVQQDNPATLIRLLLVGSQAAATDAKPTGPAMPPFDWRLNDDQAAAVLTYIRNSWGNAAPDVKASDIATLRKQFAGPQ